MQELTLTIVCLSKNNFDDIKETFLSIARSKVLNKKCLKILHCDKSNNYLKSQRIGERILKGFNYEFIKQETNGIFNGFNESLKYINSEYIFFLNTGDLLWDTNSLELIIKTCSLNNKFEFIYMDIFIKKDKSYILKRSSDKIFSCLIPFSKRFPSHQACIFKTKIHKKLKYPNFLGGDEYVIRYFFIRSIFKRRLYYLPFAISLFNLEGISSLTKISLRKFLKRSFGYLIMLLPHRILSDSLKVFPFNLSRKFILKILKR